MQSQVVSQHSNLEEWSKLSTVTDFDPGSTYPVDGPTDTGVPQEVKCFSPTSLLVESLIEQLCKLLDKDPVNQKNIYQVICKRLHKMKLIEETYGVEEFQFMRSHYQKAFIQLLNVAKSTVIYSSDHKQLVLPMPSSHLDMAAPFIQQEQFLGSQWSRYDTEYEELEYIAKGGFGQVYKARHKLDDGQYAIKKIYLRYRNVNSFLRNLREVKLLAKLNHPNIVSYKAAWLEPLDPISPQDNGKLKRRNGHKQASTIIPVNSRKEMESEEDSGGIVFKDSQSEDRSRHPLVKANMSITTTDYSTSGMFVNSNEEVSVDLSYSVNASTVNRTSMQSRAINELTSTIDSSKSSKVCNETSDSPESSPQKVVCRFVWKDEHNPWNFSSAQPEWATLYIQMQLCKCTLRQWLDERNTHMHIGSVDVKQSIEIFKQIVCGVEYIHSQCIVHHDIKPSNIFVNGDINQIQVGDFGLACFLQHSTDNVTLMSQTSFPLDHKGEIGTKLYAAPEQLNGQCEPKSDIYSLGIVLFELLQPFTTDMERSKLIDCLKTGNTPPELRAISPHLVQLIEKLLSPAPADRPTAQQLLVSLESLSSYSLGLHSLEQTNETIHQLLAVISQRDYEIEELKRRVQALEACK